MSISSLGAIALLFRHRAGTDERVRAGTAISRSSNGARCFAVCSPGTTRRSTSSRSASLPSYLETDEADPATLQLPRRALTRRPPCILPLLLDLLASRTRRPTPRRHRHRRPLRPLRHALPALLHHLAPHVGLRDESLVPRRRVCRLRRYLGSDCCVCCWSDREYDFLPHCGSQADSFSLGQYYGFYSHPALAASYMCFNFVIGVTGMIVPWQSWFNERKYKSWRIAFFVSLAASAVAPIAHRAAIYGGMETLWFYSALRVCRRCRRSLLTSRVLAGPAIPSVVAYLIGLSFYANQVSSKLRFCASEATLNLVLPSSRSAVPPATGISAHRINSGISVRALPLSRQSAR